MHFNLYCLFFVATIFFTSCTKKNNSTEESNMVRNDSVLAFTTKADQSLLLHQNSFEWSLATGGNNYNTIEVDTTTVYQSIEGLGYTLTGGSAQLLSQMDAPTRRELLSHLFSPTQTNSVGISYLRISLGASDLSSEAFSYNDIPLGNTDVNLNQFSLAKDELQLIPILKEILEIYPSIKIMSTPWSAPAWMKSNRSSIGGSLLPQYYGVYASYIARYILEMKTKGIVIDALTIQNEPQHGGNNPSMLMTSEEQALFIKNYLGPSFVSNNITTKIIIWDHNCDNPSYPISVLNDPAAASYVYGSAFHLYAGDISALSQVRAAHPSKHIYFTEQWTGSQGKFSEDFLWHMKNVMIGSIRNWSRVTLEWNLANDPLYAIHTNGGCTQCKGALTINGSAYEKNVSYYIIAQMSKWIRPNSTRVASTDIADLDNVAFVTPDGKKVLVVLNSNTFDKAFFIRHKNKILSTHISAHSAITYIW